MFEIVNVDHERVEFKTDNEAALRVMLESQGHLKENGQLIFNGDICIVKKNGVPFVPASFLR